MVRLITSTSNHSLADRLINVVVSLLIFVAVGFYTRSVPNRRMYIMAAATIPPFVGMLGMSLLPDTDEYKWTKWGMYLITVPFVLALFLAWTLSKHPFENQNTLVPPN